MFKVIKKVSVFALKRLDISFQAQIKIFLMSFFPT